MSLRNAIVALSLFATLPAYAGTFTQTNLVSDGAIPAANTDPNLKNPWGVSFAPGGAFWVSDNVTGLTTLYDSSGTVQPLVVTIPSAHGKKTLGTPTGQVFNPSSTDFAVTKGKKSGAAAFLFAAEDGTISGWSPSVDAAAAIIAVNQSSSGAVFDGLAYYTDNTGNNFLLAADLHGGVVDVFDKSYNLVTSFRDSSLESVYAPFNVAVLNGNIYVAYGWINAAGNNVIPHPGWGVVEQVSATGTVMQKVIGGKLNAPWGLAIAPTGFGTFGGDLLVGNFGDGRVTAFNATLKSKGQIKIGKKPLVISGLWALIAGNGGAGGSASDIYFTAGSNSEADGLMGSLSYSP